MLVALFIYYLRLRYCLSLFKDSLIVVLRKPSKAIYKEPKLYYPITLLDTLGKVIDTIITRRLVYIAERYLLLPKTYYRGRKANLIEYILYLVIE